MSASWLRDAVFYEIYPQSFRDSNGDGIGDIPGITEKLPYVKSLGCNALWLNPCFDSPFKDAGYDVRDYYRVAPRYGTNDDMAELFRRAHELGIKVLLDLVPGHTSEEHPWFQESGKAEKNPMSGRYIWTDGAFERGDGMPFIGGEFPRNGTYIINFFKCQPALNYGYRERNKPWQQSINSPDALATRQAMKDVIRFWLDLGCDGFRVDMADSLVKNDGTEKLATMEVWRDILGTIHEEYPEAAFVSEWNHPEKALRCGFDMDFYLEWHGNGYSSMMRDYDWQEGKSDYTGNGSFFSLHSGADASRFLADYLPQYHDARDNGLWCLITCNHDTPRPSAGLTEDERRLAFAWIFTMPGAPFLYYGDEVGMDYRALPSKEGGYHRTGSRTPMQWNAGKNLGFSEGSEESLYLPVETDALHTVQAQEFDENSLLSHVKRLIALRHAEPELQNYCPFEVYAARGRLFAYKRGSLLIAMNPGDGEETCALDRAYVPIFTLGSPSVAGKTLRLPSQSFVVLKPEEEAAPDHSDR